ncbi:MAG: homoserine kinase [Acidobacteria bacterium]|nr:homoserine kinase [Acidobacteriota bacterium]
MKFSEDISGLEIAVPGSIANLGPGFDTLAVAVRIYLRVRVAEVLGRDRSRLEFIFVDQKLRGDNFIESAFRFLAASDGLDFPSLRLEVRSEIPMRGGLGSSSAAIVAGLRLYEALAGPQPSQRLLTAAARLDGHPDNVAAALLGGLSGCCQLADGSVHAVSSPWPESLRFVVVTPEAELPTASSRRVLPDRIDRSDAVFNLQRVALLLQALGAGEHRFLKEALRDRWHQPYRQALVPGLEPALALEHPDLLGVCLSGSGPSVVGLAERNFSAVEELFLNLYRSLGIPCRVRTLAAHERSGAGAHALKER